MAKKSQKKVANKEKRKCFLPPYEIKQTMSVQQAGEQPGWQITSFDLPEAWKYSQGEGVVVAVIDTGCDLDHPDLKENLVILRGSNFINPRKPPIDDNAHGTHCTGIICALKNGHGIVGVAPRCKVMPIKVLDKNGNGDFLDAAKAIRFAVDKGADIISMSLGAPFKFQQVRKAIQYAKKKGVPVFCAAGNAGKTKNIFYPARYPESISVGSIDENFDRSSFSNTGQNLDFMAPGGEILSCVPDNWYAVMSGTSMACPFAVATAALLLSYKRTKGKKIKLNLPGDYRNLMMKHTIPITNKKWAGKKFFQGFGIIDPRQFMEAMKQNKALKLKFK
jgi:subtilisin family serine protease